MDWLRAGVMALVLSGCVAAPASTTDGGTDASVSDGGRADGGVDAGPCLERCATDGSGVLDCQGHLVQACSATQSCGGPSPACVEACTLAANAAGSDRKSVV